MKELQNSFWIELEGAHLDAAAVIEIFPLFLDSFPAERRRHFSAGSNLISLENA